MHSRIAHDISAPAPTMARRGMCSVAHLPPPSILGPQLSRLRLVYLARSCRDCPQLSLARSYSFGVVLVELVTGKVPCEAARLFTFNGPSVFDDMKSLADPKAEWPAKVLREVPPVD